jgi:hypothetical protein
MHLMIRFDTGAGIPLAEHEPVHRARRLLGRGHIEYEVCRVS